MSNTNMTNTNATTDKMKEKINEMFKISLVDGFILWATHTLSMFELIDDMDVVMGGMLESTLDKYDEILDTVDHVNAAFGSNIQIIESAQSYVSQLSKLVSTIQAHVNGETVNTERFKSQVSSMLKVAQNMSRNNVVIEK